MELLNITKLTNGEIKDKKLQCRYLKIYLKDINLVDTSKNMILKERNTCGVPNVLNLNDCDALDKKISIQ